MVYAQRREEQSLLNHPAAMDMKC